MTEEESKAAGLALLRHATVKGVGVGTVSLPASEPPSRASIQPPVTTNHTVLPVAKPFIDHPRHVEVPNIGGGSGDSEYHEWKITELGADPDSEEDPPPMRWTVTGGVVDVFLVADATVDGDNGNIYLKLTRDSSSRAVLSAEIMFSSDALASTEIEQYVLLGFVNSAAEDPIPTIYQYQFERLNIKELMLVENGEFTLGSFRMSSENTYTPPAP